MKYLLLLVLVGCGITNPTQTKQEAQTLEYYKDTRTNLCFVRNAVENSNGFAYNVFTNVPCTPEVEKLITK
jgi:hypothetical protein